MPGGPLGCEWDWEGNGGHCINDCLKCEPCCGDPCNVKDGAYCFFCFWCCGPCTACKMWASSMGQECAIVNHCLPILIPYFTIWMGTSTRAGLRMKHGVGENGCTLGDCLMTCCVCTCACSHCQHCRSVPISDWDWFEQCQNSGVVVTAEPCLCIRASS